MLEMLGAIVGLLSFLVTLLPILLIYYLILRFRMKFFIVHEFSNENVKLPEVVNKVGNELTAKYACSFTKNNQFYLTTSRVIFHCQSFLRGKYFTRYFDFKSIRNVEIIYKNPYGWLIWAGFQVLLGIIYAASSISKSSNNSNIFYKESSSSNAGAAFLIIFVTLIDSGFYVLLWYYLRGFYLAFDNSKTSGLFCRSKEGLEDTLKRFDILKYTNKTGNFPIQKTEIPESKDVICSSCKSVISLEADDLKSSTFDCPICSTVNSIR